MTAETALDKQIERYRQMTGEQRLKIALDLHEMSCNIARADIRRQLPDANETEVERLLHARIESEREIKNEDERMISTACWRNTPLTSRALRPAR
jgi:type II secretory pathway predicted ATPase ExeA